MVPVFIASAAWIIALLGLGHLAGRALAPGADPGTKGLLGFFVLAVAGTALHLLVPLSPAIGGGALAIGCAAFAFQARRILEGTSAAQFLGLAVLLAALSFLNAFPVRHYDMGLYWLQAVKWNTEWAQVPGLATLHARLGFNCSWFTVAAMLEHPLAIGKSAFLTTTPLLFFGSWTSIEAIRDIGRGRRDPATFLAASGALLVVTCASQLGGHSPDAAGAVIGFAALVALARSLHGPEPFQLYAITALVLAAFAFTIKASNVVLFAATVGIGLLRWRWLDRRLVGKLAGAAAALLLPWVASGYVNSGCPLFPSTVGCVEVRWATPIAIAEDITAWIRSWARAPGLHPSAVLGRWDWLPGWTRGMLGAPTVQFLLVALPAALLALLLLRIAGRGREAPSWGEPLPIWGTALAGTAFWFAMAPTPRFAWAYLFAAALIPSAHAAAQLFALWPGWKPAVALSAIALTSAGWLAWEAIGWVRHVPSAGYEASDWPRMPQSVAPERETLPGLRVRVPVGTDQCWAAPLPCAPTFDPGLAWEEGAFRSVNRRPGASD